MVWFGELKKEGVLWCDGVGCIGVCGIKECERWWNVRECEVEETSQV